MKAPLVSAKAGRTPARGHARALPVQAVVILCALAAGFRQAAGGPEDPTTTIAWQPVQGVVGDSDVSTLGSLLYAYTFGTSQPVTVNAVTFTGFVTNDQQSVTNGPLALTETDPNHVLANLSSATGTALGGWQMWRRSRRKPR